VEAATILFGIGCAVSLWFAVRSGDKDARIVAAYLVVVWGLANAAWLANMLVLLPLLDFWLGVIAVTIWWTTQAKWVALIVNAVAIRLVLHVLDALTGHSFLIAYIHALNATFVWMLVVVAYGGGHNGSGLADHMRRRFLRMVRVLRTTSAREMTCGD